METNNLSERHQKLLEEFKMELNEHFDKMSDEEFFDHFKPVKQITEKGAYEFEDNYELIFKDDNGNYIHKCDIKCGDKCRIDCGSNFKINCGSNCVILCGYDCQINCGNNCIIDCKNSCKILSGENCNIDCGYKCEVLSGKKCQLVLISDSYAKVGKESRIYSSNGTISQLYDIIVSKEQEFIWWHVNKKWELINTHQNELWKKQNFLKYEKFYGFVDNELDSATLF